MKQIFNMSVFVMTLAVTQSSFAAEHGVDGRGGTYSRFFANELNRALFGSLKNNIYVVDRQFGDRNGCFLWTPEYKATHTNGFATIEIKLEANWLGYINPQTTSNKNLFQIGVSSSSNPNLFSGVMNNGRMLLTNDVIEPDGRFYQFASTNGWYDYTTPELPINKNDQITVKICNMASEAWANFHSIYIHSYPR